MRSFFRRSGEYAVLLLILAALVVLFGCLSQRFLTAATFGSVANRIPTLTLLATGMTLVLVIGAIDLSVGSVVALAGSVLGVMLVDRNWPLPLSAGLAVLVGTGVGLVNGGITVGLRVPSFIVTLGTLEMARGLAYLTTHSQTKYLGGKVEMLAHPLGGLLLTPATLVALTTVAVAQLVLSRAVVGRKMIAIGTNETATRLAGIAVAPVKILVFAVAGALAGLAAVVPGRAARRERPQRRRGPGTERHRRGGHRRHEPERRAWLGRVQFYRRADHCHAGSGAGAGGRIRAGETSRHRGGDRLGRGGGRGEEERMRDERGI